MLWQMGVIPAYLKAGHTQVSLSLAIQQDAITYMEQAGYKSNEITLTNKGRQ